MASDSATPGLNDAGWPIFEDYKDLNQARREIRLLEPIKPRDSSSDRLIYNLIPCSLDKIKNQYYALSYHWGVPPEPEEFQRIQLGDAEVRVLPTTYSFLYRVRQHFPDSLLWLDGLCINQANEKERDQQVSLMGNIFGSAKRVLSWLGEGNADTRYVMDFFSGRVLPYIDSIDSIGVEGATIFNIDRLLNGLEQLITRQYWKRVWVVQEVVGARKVTLLCGDRKVDWADFAIKGLDLAMGKYNPEVVINDASTVAIVKELWGRRVQAFVDAKERSVQCRKPHIYEVIREFSHAECTDARDRFFGFRGLSADQEIFEVEYKLKYMDTIFRYLTRMTKAHSEAILTYDTREKPDVELIYSSFQMMKDLYPILRLNNYHLKEGLTPSRDDSIALVVPQCGFVSSLQGVAADKEASGSHNCASIHLYLQEKKLKSKRWDTSGSTYTTVTGELPKTVMSTLRSTSVKWEDWPTLKQSVTERNELPPLSRCVHSHEKLGLLSVYHKKEGSKSNSFTRVPRQISANSIEVCCLMPSFKWARKTPSSEDPPICERQWMQVHISRAMLILLVCCSLGRMVPPSVVEHLEKVSSGEIEERLCHCDPKMKRREFCDLKECEIHGQTELQCPDKERMLGKRNNVPQPLSVRPAKQARIQPPRNDTPAYHG